jgi:integrase
VDVPKSSKSRRKLPLDARIIERLKSLKPGPGEWLFQSRAGTPLNPGNVLRRFVYPAARACGFEIGGWHDFRHTATTNMRRNGTQPKVASDILGHERVNLAMDVYDRTDASDFEQALGVIAAGLVSSGIKSAATA